MVKLILLAKRKKGMSRQEFIDYYENVHTPLADQVFPKMADHCTRHRNYVVHEQVMIPAGFTGEVEYDVITESIWESKEALDKFVETAMDPEVSAPYREDEANLFDLDSMRFFVVDMRKSEMRPK